MCFSFIIPHYSIPDLLQRCVSTIPQRDDTEIIIVDDDSPGFDSYPKQYPGLFRADIQWIRVPKHGGAGYARNLGLKESSGKWVLFADADDFFENGLNDFLDEFRDAPDDLIYFRTSTVQSDNPKEEAKSDKWYGDLFEMYFKSKCADDLRFNHGVPWGKMIRRELLIKNQIRFEEIPYSNDTVFSTLVGSKAESIQVANRCLYVKTVREGSLTWKFAQKPGELAIRTDAAIRSYKIMKTNGYNRPLFPLSHYLYKMYYYDRSLFRKYFRRIPEVYPSYWIPLKEMAQNERGLFRKGLLYAYSLFTYLTTRQP